MLSLQPILGFSTQLSKISNTLIDPGRLLLRRSNTYSSLQINSIEPLGRYAPLIQPAKFLTDRQEQSKIGWDNWQPRDLEDRFAEIESERSESNTAPNDNDSSVRERNFELDIFTQILDEPSEYNMLAEDDFTVINDIDRQTRSESSKTTPIVSQKNLPQVDVDRDLSPAESIVNKPIIPDRPRSSKTTQSKQNTDNISHSTQVNSIESDVSAPDILTDRFTNLGAEEISTPTIEDRSISSQINSIDDLPTIFREPAEGDEVFADIFRSELSTDLVNTESSSSNSFQLPQVESIITNEIEQPPTIFRETNDRQQIFSDVFDPEVTADLITPKSSTDNLPRLPQTDSVLPPTRIENTPPIVSEINPLQRESIDTSNLELSANSSPTDIRSLQGENTDIYPPSATNFIDRVENLQPIVSEIIPLQRESIDTSNLALPANLPPTDIRSLQGESTDIDTPSTTNFIDRVENLQRESIDTFNPTLSANLSPIDIRSLQGESTDNQPYSIEQPIQLSINRSIEPDYPPTTVHESGDINTEFIGVDTEPSVNFLPTINTSENTNQSPSNLIDRGSLDNNDNLSTIFHEDSLVGEELFTSNITDSSAKLVSPKASEDRSISSPAPDLDADRNPIQPNILDESIDLTTQFTRVESEPFENLSTTEINTEITSDISLKSSQTNPIVSTTEFTSDSTNTPTENREVSETEPVFTDIFTERSTHSLQNTFNPEIAIDNLAENSFTTDIDRVPSVLSEVKESQPEFTDILPERAANFDSSTPNTDHQLSSSQTDSMVTELTNINESDNTPIVFRHIDERVEIFTDSEPEPSARLVRAETTNETKHNSSLQDLDLDRSSPIFSELSDTAYLFTNVVEEPELLARSIDAEIAIENEPQLAQIDSMPSEGASTHDSEDSPAIRYEASLETDVWTDVSMLEQPNNLAPSDINPQLTEETKTISNFARVNPNEIEHPPTIFRVASVDSDVFVDSIAPALPANLTPEVNIPQVTEILPSLTEEPDIVEHPLPVKGYATGGKVTTDRGLHETIHPSDTVSAMLAPNEFVVNVKDAQKNLNLLEHINSGRELTEFIAPTLAPDISPSPEIQQQAEPISTKVESLPTKSLQLKPVDSLISPSLEREIGDRQTSVFNDSPLNTFSNEHSEIGKKSVNYDSPSLIFRKPQSTGSSVIDPPMQWNTVEDLLNGGNEPQTIFNFTDRSESQNNNFGNESNPSPQIFAKHSPLFSNIDRQEYAIDRVITTDAQPITEMINNPSVQTAAGTSQADDLENLAREIYYRLRQRLEIERERQGVTHGRIAW
jgi:hypothetical protein